MGIQSICDILGLPESSCYTYNIMSLIHPCYTKIQEAQVRQETEIGRQKHRWVYRVYVTHLGFLNLLFTKPEYRVD